jgi:hypothetical protein
MALVVHDDRGGESYHPGGGSSGSDDLGYVDPYADLGSGYSGRPTSSQRPSYGESPSYSEPPSYAEPPSYSEPPRSNTSSYGSPPSGGGADGGWQDPNNLWNRP